MRLLLFLAGFSAGFLAGASSFIAVEESYAGDFPGIDTLTGVCTTPPEDVYGLHLLTAESVGDDQSVAVWVINIELKEGLYQCRLLMVRAGCREPWEVAWMQCVKGDSL